MSRAVHRATSRCPSRIASKLIQVPLVPFVPALSILVNILLMLHLAPITWLRLIVWLTIGKSHSRVTIITDVQVWPFTSCTVSITVRRRSAWSETTAFSPSRSPTSRWSPTRGREISSQRFVYKRLLNKSGTRERRRGGH